MKSLDVCDSTQNDDDKESGKEREGQENKENRTEENVCGSLNGGDEVKLSDVVVKSEPVEKESRECSETREENSVNEGGADSNGSLENRNGETDETTPTSTDEGRLIDLSEDELNSETNSGKECVDPCQVVSDSVSCSKESDPNVEIDKSSFDDSTKQLQKLKDDAMDVDSASAAEDPYKDVKSIIETSPVESFKEEGNSSDNNTVADKNGRDERGFDMDEDTILDPDCDKENEKNVEDSDVDGFSKRDKEDSRVSLEGSSSECDIRVGECQTISGSDKDFLWSENESKKSQDSEECSAFPALDESSCREESGEKEGNKCLGEDEVAAETDEEKGKRIDSKRTKSGAGKTTEKDSDESYSNKTDSDSESGKHSPSSPQMESANSRKRKKVNEDESAAESKRKKSECDDVVMKSVSEGESGNDSSPSKNPSCVDTELTKTLAGQCETERTIKKRTLIGDTNSKKSKTSGEETERLNTQETIASSFLTNLRGTLKNLTRGDLEELIVQKLCEVITERSTIGELRRKAQALEEDQERWRNKVQMLTKQMREMEMVMKKYMSEVQKQVRENTYDTVTPIKVTRSVGLQVSFYSSSSKQSKPSSSPSTPNPAQNANAKNAKPAPPKLLPHFTSVPAPRNKSAASPLKSPAQPPKTPPNQVKKTVTTRSDSGSLPSKNTVPSPTNANRTVQNQVPAGTGIKISYKPPSAVQLPQQQNGSKVIDLTDDDDKQPGSVVNKPQSPIRVVNHLSQSQVQANARFTYYVPKTSTPGTGTSPSGQNRQVLIATPMVPQQNRPLMCPMPPLLFKGGNIGPGPGPQAQAQNPNNRVILPKTLRHPAPLPQAPANPITRKNMKLLPPRPALKISKVQTGIVLSWNMTLGPEHAPIASYQLYAYQESNSPPTTSLWKKVGDVKALPLPMACTLTQFMSGHKYHFAVRAVDHHCRLGPFSFPGTIVLVK